MKFTNIRIVVLTGLIAFIGIIAIQVYWLRQAFDLEEKKFTAKIERELFIEWLKQNHRLIQFVFH